MEFKDKFIGFLDILGFKNLVEAAETGAGMSLPDLLQLTKKLGSADDRKRFETHGPIACPQSTYIQRDLDFQLAQISDCVIVSSEVSPAGAINLVMHCWDAVVNLLAEGIMCRGYITRGSIYHDGAQFIGSGYQNAYLREAQVSAFKRQADERGTPFVEVDPVVCKYVRDCGDRSMKKMFSRYVKTDGDATALFPFQRLQHSFIIGREFDQAKERKSNQNMRVWIETLRQRIMEFTDKSNSSAVNKAAHYVKALNDQLVVCDWTDHLIGMLPSTQGGHRVKEAEQSAGATPEPITKIKELPNWPPYGWRSADQKSLSQGTAVACHVKNVIIPLMTTNFVTLEIEHDNRVYSTDLVVPKDLKDRVGFTLLFAMNVKLTLGKMGEMAIK